MKIKDKLLNTLYSYYTKLVSLTALGFLFFSCAQIGTPSGGIYDRTPPKARVSKPSHNSTNFKGNSFEINFDEYINTENTSEEIIISPPLQNKPTIKAHLKTLKVSWTDTLRENTTYIFDFGSSIIDFTEGNKISNFVYSFSTGDVIDTFEYKGRVLDAYNLKPIAKKYVMLYKSEDHEVAKKEKPSYITRTDSIGYFHFQNISEGTFQIFSLDDKNQNLIYDLSNEGFAFEKERIESTIYKTDSTRKAPSYKDNVLYFYEPKDTTINLESNKLLSNHRLQLIFSNPTTDSLNLLFEYPKLSGKDDTNLYLQYSTNKDTIDIWTLNQTFDSIKMIITDRGFRENIELFSIKEKEDPTKDTFSLKTPSSKQSFFEKTIIEMPFPIIDTTKIYKALKITTDDTTEIKLKTSSFSPLYLEIIDVLPSNSNQKIFIPQGIITNTLNQTNDSLSFPLQVDSESDYGNFFLNIDDTINANMSYILILEDIQGKTLRKELAQNKARVNFMHLKEGEYKLRIIFDMNQNGVWNFGDYSKRQMPEEIKYFSKPINIRQNWDLEETWHN